MSQEAREAYDKGFKDGWAQKKEEVYNWRSRTCGECARVMPAYIRTNGDVAFEINTPASLYCRLMKCWILVGETAACGPDFVPREVPE